MARGRIAEIALPTWADQLRVETDKRTGNSVVVASSGKRRARLVMNAMHDGRGRVLVKLYWPNGDAR